MREDVDVSNIDANWKWEMMEEKSSTYERG